MDYQNFFNRDFFHTPVEVIDQMMQFSEVQGKIVLEPSAGSGNIVDWLRNMGAKQVCACEINDRLRSMISSRCDIIGLWNTTGIRGNAKEYLPVFADGAKEIQ